MLAMVLAAVFIRLGVWQLDRLAQRRARNAAIARRLAQPPEPIERLGDTTSYRRMLSHLRPKRPLHWKRSKRSSRSAKK